MKENILNDKTFAFSIRAIKLYQLLSKEKSEYVISKQLLRSGTSIGANVWEANSSESKNDFIHKPGIALKEANETEYWLLLLKETSMIGEKLSNSLISDCRQIIKILKSSILTTKSNLK